MIGSVIPALLDVARGGGIKAEQREAAKAEAEKNRVQHGSSPVGSGLNQRLRVQGFDWEMRSPK